MKKENTIRTGFHMYRTGVSPQEIARELSVHRATVYRWIKDFRYLGLERTLKKRSKAMARTQSRKITGIVKNRICRIRREKRDCCGEKIQYYYQKEYGEKVSISKIYEVLNERGRIQRRYKKEPKYGEAPVGTYDRDVVQGDTVDFGGIYAYTYVDTFNRQAFVDLELDLESYSGLASLGSLHKVFGDIYLLQTDGGPEFEGHFSKNVLQYAQKHRVSRPYKKNEQSYIESFNRTLRKECFGWCKYTVSELPSMLDSLEDFLRFYNSERPHLGLDMKTPNEVASCRICE
jgi:transposase